MVARSRTRTIGRSRRVARCNPNHGEGAGGGAAADDSQRNRGAGLPILGPLAVSDDDEKCLVVDADDEEDWVVRFDKSDAFPAREWADSMVNVYNRRVHSPRAGTAAARRAARP